MIIDNLVKMQLKNNVDSKESQLGFCQNLLKYYENKDISQVIMKMKYNEIVKNFDSNLLHADTDINSIKSSLIFKNEIKKSSELSSSSAINRFESTRKQTTISNKKGRNIISEFDQAKS